jgi:CBS domain containing-hemolysin-like protein
MVVLVFWIAIAIVGTHLCSLLETTLFSARVPALLVQKAAGSRGAVKLLSIKRHRINDAIGAVLILNTVANTLGSSFAGAQTAALFGPSKVIYLSVGLTIALLFLSELIPKTIAVRYPGALSAAAGHSLSLIIPVLRPLLIVTNAIVYAIARRPGERVTRRELDQVIRTAGSEGALTTAESQLIGSVMKSSGLLVADVMTPIEAVFSMNADQTLESLLRSRAADAFSRIPLYQNQPDNIQGYLPHRDALKASAQGADTKSKLSLFMQPIPRVTAEESVENVLKFVLGEHEAIAIVYSRQGAAVGLVTLEDLFEAILGVEITDEAETIVRLRPAVSAHRKSRLAKLRKRQVEDEAS